MSHSRIRHLSLAFVAFATVAAFAQLSTPAVSQAKDGGLLGIEGVLINVDPVAGTVTIRTRRMQDVLIATNAATKIERNDRRATLAMFQLGDRVEAKLTSAMSNVTIKVKATGP